MIDVMQTALGGLKAAEQRAAQAASNIAQFAATSEAGPSSGATAGVVTAPVTGEGPAGDGGPFAAEARDFATAGEHDLATDFVALMIAQHAYEANAAVVRTADEMVGTLVNRTV